MPVLDSLAYDPNAETMWNNQVVNFQECLYEYRESAEFIAFPDWDDLLVAPEFRPLPAQLKTMVAELSGDDADNIGSFIIERHPGRMPTLGECE